jgi:hypothetical protein
LINSTLHPKYSTHHPLVTKGIMAALSRAFNEVPMYPVKCGDFV